MQSLTRTAAAGLVTLALVLVVLANGRSARRISAVSEDTVLDKMRFDNPKRMCCGPVAWPCCHEEACCDAWEENQLGEADKAKPMQLYEVEPLQVRSPGPGPAYVRQME